MFSTLYDLVRTRNILGDSVNVMLQLSL